MNTEDLQKQFNKEFTEQAIILDKYISKCHELEQKLSACETILEDTQQDFAKVFKLLKSMTLSIAAHPDCFKRPDGASSEFYDLVEMAEKVLEGTLYTRHG